MKIGPFNKILILGSGQILRSLSIWALNNKYSVKVITSPRHSKEIINNKGLETFLKEQCIPFLVTDKFKTKEVLNFIGDTNETFCLSLGAAWIFTAKTISGYFKNKLLNLHGTRLPQNRGGGGFSWQILTANRFGFCNLHLIDGGIDTGEIIEIEEFLYPATCRIPIDYEKVYVEKNLNFLKTFLKKTSINCINVKTIPQVEYFSSYWPRLHTITNAWIDWSLESFELERFICAFDAPYEGAQTMIKNKRIHITNVSLNLQDGVFHSYQSGLIYRKTKSWICVCIKGAAIIIEKVLDEDGSDYFPFLNVGDRFFTPVEKLESSKQRVIYKPTGLK